MKIARVGGVLSRLKIVVFTTKKRPRRSPVERAMRIELTTKAWEAFVLPLNYARIVTL